MFSLRTARGSSKIAGLFLLGSFIVPGVGFAQPASEVAGEADRLRLITAAVREERERNGPFSAGLIEPLSALVLLYQEAGDHALAAAAIGEARQVVRANHGLHSLEEAPLLWQLIDSEEATADFRAAWNLEQELLTLTERHAGDLRTVPILRELAGRRMEALGDYLDGGFPPQIVLGCYYSRRIHEWGVRRLGGFHEGCSSGSSTVVVAAFLEEAQSYYTRSIDLLLQNDQGASEELRDVVTDLMRSSYQIRDYGLKADLDVIEVLRGVIDHETGNADATLNRAHTLVQLADWEVLSAHHLNRLSVLDPVLDIYGQAYEEFDDQRSGQRPDAIFSPRLPVVLPSFLPNPLASDEAGDTVGYIDIAFDITRYGKSERIEIIESTPGVRRSSENRLVRQIRQSSFRPRTTDGRFAESSRVELRYYVSD